MASVRDSRVRADVMCAFQDSTVAESRDPRIRKSKSSEKLQKRHHTSTGCVRSLGMTHKSQITLTYSQLWEIQKALSRVITGLAIGEIEDDYKEERMETLLSTVEIVRPEVDRLLELIENDLVEEETVVLWDDEEIKRFFDK